MTHSYGAPLGDELKEDTFEYELMTTIRMACSVANFVAKQEYLISFKDWTKFDTTSCLIRVCFENLKDLRV